MKLSCKSLARNERFFARSKAQKVIINRTFICMHQNMEFNKSKSCKKGCPNVTNFGEDISFSSIKFYTEFNICHYIILSHMRHH